ncbi:MAG: TetR/AcrR family transcriptional regulator [Arthrobacter sp.]|uniref:TetR/AcrR family transcriptional regulator n=1 Tax=Arthrobacter sp. TaxID=1667 RepID=UPI003472F874
MPKIVDHDQRRAELVDATWRIIARHGLDGATLREVAAEAGFANGALKPYFPTKSDLIQAAFGHVFERTNRRVAEGTDGLAGLAALRAFAREVLPLDDERLAEARAVMPFWQMAVNDPRMLSANAEAMERWRRDMLRWLAEAAAAGELRGGIDTGSAAEGLLTFLLGAQVVAVLDPGHNGPGALVAQLDSHLGMLRTG